MGIARVPDERLERLSAIFRPRKTTPATFEVVDLAGIARGEAQGLDTQEFRNADGLLHVVRAFPDATGAPPNPGADISEVETELILADLGVVERRLDRLDVSLRRKRTDTEAREREVLLRIKPALEAGTPIRALALAGEDEKAVRGFTFLSQKPVLHCLNLSEKDVARGITLAESFGLGDVAAQPKSRLGWVSAVIEAEVAQLAGEEQAAFLGDLGLREPAITRVLRDCYGLLGLISFFTVGDDEIRAWSVPRGTRAQDAAGVIHSDMERGFIRAEAVGCEELIAAGGDMGALRERGRLRLEGKDYPVEDGEIFHVRFNVTR
jgi:GTP-binding protein YchF